ncbi:MAG: hypothetical protein ACHRHE_16620 [Tepidisphaerales bacterium]
MLPPVVSRDPDLNEADKARLQGIVEKIHARWAMDRHYLPPPATGTLATLDAAMIVTPPKWLEAGYVPIVVRQASR